VKIFNPDEVSEAGRAEGGFATWIPIKPIENSKTQEQAKNLIEMMRSAVDSILKRQDELEQALFAELAKLIDRVDHIERSQNAKAHSSDDRS
jgi:transcription termination factor NusB